MPSILKVFEKEEYTVTLTITENNVKHGSVVYFASELSDKTVLLENDSNSSNSETSNKLEDTTEIVSVHLNVSI